MLVLRGLEEQGSGQREAFARLGLTCSIMPGEKSRTGHSSEICKLKVNLSRETRKKAGKHRGARLERRHQRRQLLERAGGGRVLGECPFPAHESIPASLQTRPHPAEPGLAAQSQRWDQALMFRPGRCQPAHFLWFIFPLLPATRFFFLFHRLALPGCGENGITPPSCAAFRV